MKLLEWAKQARTKISGLDADLIAMHVLGFVDRVELILHVEDDYDFSAADELVEKRASGIPVAYLLGYKEFYGRNFKVNQTVLIPRPETEQIIISALGIIDTEKYEKVSIIDVGTGSGCIPITLKLELNENGVASDISGVDVSAPALETAKENANNLGTDVKFFSSDLLSNIETLPDIITANLPYVDVTWDWISPDLKFEPALALYAGDGGLKLIKKLIDEVIAKRDDKSPRFLILEADTSQHDDIIEYVKEHNFDLVSHNGFILTFRY